MNTIFKTNSYKILELFIKFPNRDFFIRGIAREIKLSHVTILKHIVGLQKSNLIKKKEDSLYPTYYANTENEQYKFYKKNYLILKLINSGLIEEIKEQTLASSIVLFGSGAKGTFTPKSDIDIFVEARQKKLVLSKYENKIGYKINLLFEPSVKNLTPELRNNIINGTVLYGFIKVN
jgi:predicted nucleotidyltransferase